MSGELFDGEIPFGCMDSEHFMALRNNFILVNASDAVEVSFAKNSEQQYYKNIFHVRIVQPCSKMGVQPSDEPKSCTPVLCL